MAIEAARQLSDPSKTIHGCKLENVNFSKPLLVTLESEGVETQLELRQHKVDKSSVQASFQMFTYAKNKWIEVCLGFYFGPHFGLLMA